MLNKLELVNFRRHEHRSFDFSNGLTAMRGANEAGKSTVTEAIAFALFGSRALRDTLDNVVTWGKAARTLRVLLTVTMQGRTYSFLRHKGGAEVLEGNDVIVTGQNEVSAFAAQLLGGDLTICNKLLFANQGNMRGSLSEGPKATAELIETLANFDLFDHLIELIQRKLMVGNPAVLESRLKQAELALADTPEPEKVDVSCMEFEVEALKVHVAKVEKSRDAIAKLMKDHLAWKEIYGPKWVAYSVAKLEADKHKQRVDAAREHYEGLQAKVLPAVPDIDQIRMELLHANQFEEVRSAFSEFSKYKPPTQRWDGDRVSFDAEVNRCRESRQAHLMKVAECKGQVSTLTSRIVTSLNCPTCGSEIKDADKIAEQNSRLRLEIDKLNKQVYESSAEAAKEEHMLGILAGIGNADTEASRLVAKYGSHITVSNLTVPPSLTWITSLAEAPPKVADIQRKLAQAEELQKAEMRHQGAIDSAREQLAALEKRVIDIPEAVDSWEEREAAYAANISDHTDANTRLTNLNQSVQMLQQKITQAKTNAEAAQVRYAKLQQEVEERRGDLESLTFNNTLLKKVRAARPQVGDKLWNTVLSSVSLMFTQMRGEPSLVEKSKDGFTVNGAPVSSLSGSTLDLLALAIRTALTRTFIPQASFMLLDEPGAACDNGRVLSMLAFLATAGFTQTILVSHDDVVDGVADHLIQL